MPQQLSHRRLSAIITLAVIVVLGLSASGPDPTPAVAPGVEAVSVVALAPVPSPPDVPAREHEVSVQARGSGAVFTVTGEVFGQTGPIEMPSRARRRAGDLDAVVVRAAVATLVPSGADPGFHSLALPLPPPAQQGTRA